MIKDDGHIVLSNFGLACSLEAIMSPKLHLSSSLGADTFEPVSPQKSCVAWSIPTKLTAFRAVCSYRTCFLPNKGASRYLSSSGRF